MLIRGSTRFRPSTFLHRHLWKIQISQCKSKNPLSPKGLLLISSTRQFKPRSCIFQWKTIGVRDLGIPPFWPSPLLQSKLLKEGEKDLQGTQKNTQGFGPYQNHPFHDPPPPPTHIHTHCNKRGSYRKRPHEGHFTSNSNQWFSSGRGKLNNLRRRGRANPSSR